MDKIDITQYLIAIILLLVMACVPDTIITTQPMPTSATTVPPKYLNHNPQLSFGSCERVSFVTEQWGVEWITQCAPDGYTLYETVMADVPLRIEYTGAVYSTRPNGAYGDIGFTLPVMHLPEGCYAIHATGEAHMWGEPTHYSIVGRAVTDSLSMVMGKHNLTANGDYDAMFILDAQATDYYTVSVYLHLQYPSATADSYLTFDSITVEAVDAGHCNDIIDSQS